MTRRSARVVVAAATCLQRAVVGRLATIADVSFGVYNVRICRGSVRRDTVNFSHGVRAGACTITSTSRHSKNARCCFLKAKFHYAIQLANQLASWFASEPICDQVRANLSATGQKPGLRAARNMVADLLASCIVCGWPISITLSSSLAAR